MSTMLINATQPDEVRVAITQNGLLIDLDVEHAEQQQQQSNIYKGTITSIEPHLDAVFINYGREKHGFLPLKEISEEYFLTELKVEDGKNNIKKLLRIGQELVVQVEKDERGTKGAALTTYISLAGSYLVLMPNKPKAGGISRRIEGEEREQLKQNIGALNLPDEMSVIIRTAGVGRSREELQWDLDVLLSYWEAIKQAAIAKTGPYLIHQESDVIIRAIRDYLRQDIEQIILDEASAYERAHAYISRVRPSFIDNLKLYSDNFPLFSRYQVEQQIENAHQHEVQLPSGGSIVIDHTEALVAIDINSARATKGSNIEETAFNTNKEAAEEIARQMRIRDIGGLIVIDFIDMNSNQNQRQVESVLREAMKQDRARIQIGRISRFGLLELSRQRIRSALVKVTHNTCPYCTGRGTIRSVESLALSILHLIQEHAATASTEHLQLQLPVDIATYIMNEKRDTLQAINEFSTIKVTLIPNPHIKSPNYDLKVIANPKTIQQPSYKLLQIPQKETIKHAAKYQQNSEPAIKQFLTTPDKDKLLKKKTQDSVIKRLWGFMFNSEATPADTPKEPQNKPTHKNNQASRPKNKSSQTRRGGRGGSRNKPADKPKSKANTLDNNPQKTAAKRKQGAKKQSTKKTTGNPEKAKKNTKRTTPSNYSPVDKTKEITPPKTIKEAASPQPAKEATKTTPAPTIKTPPSTPDVIAIPTSLDKKTAPEQPKGEHKTTTYKPKPNSPLKQQAPLEQVKTKRDSKPQPIATKTCDTVKESKQNTDKE